MLESGISVVPFSIWGGGGEFNGIEVRRFKLRELWSLFWLLPFWLCTRPRVFVEILTELFGQPCPSIQNWNETFLGFGFALVRASKMKKEGFALCHAVWATMPASAALAIKKLVGIEFSMGGHAYDIFRGRGDWLLSCKLRHAAFVRTSSASAQKRLLELGLPQEKLKLIYRGLNRWPKATSTGRKLAPVEVLSVGRLVEKKGYFEQLAIYRALEEAGIPFRARIVGGGPLCDRLKTESRRLALEDKVFFLGPLPEEKTFELYSESDLFFFTGKVAGNGDRDGLPNVIPEAMSAGVVVITSATGGASEALQDGETGFVRNPRHPQEWVALVEHLRVSPDRVVDLRQSAKRAARRLFDVNRTAKELTACLLEAARKCQKNPKQASL